MYKIIGANQVEYGPVSADQLRQWIAEGRVNAQTPIQAEGDATWKPLAMFPEFASSLPPAPGPAPAPAPMSAGMPPGMSATAPAPFGAAPGDDGGRARALSLVSGPAIALLVTAILGVLWTLLRMGMQLIMGASMATLPGFADNNPNPEVTRAIMMMSGAMGIVIYSLQGILWAIVLWGSLKMKKLEGYGLAIAASIIAMIPCVCPCCIIGLPFGIWALVVLSKPEVKQYFS